MLKKKFAAAIAVLAFLAAPACYALTSPLTWQFAGWYAGGCFPVVLPDASAAGRVFLTSDVAGVWRSDDRGNKWNFRTKGAENVNTPSIAIAPSNPSVLYNGTKAGMHKSTDGGATWKFLSATKNKVTFKRPDNYRAIAIDRTNPSKVYAGTKGGSVYYSQDGGTTWALAGGATYPFGSAVPISSLWITSDNATLLAGSSSGLAKLTRSGGSWTRVTSLSGGKAYDIVGKGSPETVYVTNGARVAYTTDKGVSWTYTATIPSSRTAYRLDVRVEAAGVKILLGWIAGWEGGVYLSKDKGRTWTDLERGLVYDVLGDPTRTWTKGFGKANSVAIDPYDSNILYFTDWWGIFRSDDGGLTWRERITGAPNTVGSEIITTSSGAILVGTMDNGLLRSTDNGVSYKASLPSAAYTSASYLGHVWRVATAGTKIIATSAPWDVKVNQVAVSNDGGVTFQLYRTGLPATRPVKNTVWDQGYARGLAVDPKNPSKIYLGIDGDDGGGLYVSSNGGTSWTRSSGQPASKRIYNALEVDPVTTTRLYWGTVGTGGGIYKSENSGASWAKVFSGSSYIFDMEVSKEGVVYAAGDATGPCLYVSRDKGATWQLLKRFTGTSGACEGITIDPNNSKRIAVSTTRWEDYTGGKVYVTTDGGVSWTDVTADLPGGTGAADLTFSRDGLYLYLSRYAGSVYRLKL